MRADAVVPRCDHDVGCITCGDTAVPMRVVAVDRDRELALCANAEGAHETVETALVAPVTEGATLLVHAAVAIQLIEPGAQETAA